MDHVIISNDNKCVVGLIAETGVIQVWSMQSGDPATRVAITGEMQDSNKRNEHQAHIILPSGSQTVICGVADEVKVLLFNPLLPRFSDSHSLNTGTTQFQ